MAPFDGNGGPQQGNPGVQPLQQRPPMPPGHPGMPNQGMPPGHHRPMNPPHYTHQNSGNMGGMPGQPPPPYPMPQSPANGRQPSYSGMPQNPGQYSSHPPLHSPRQHQGGPPPPQMHPNIPHPSHPQQQMHRTGSMGRSTSSSMGHAMPPMQQDPMRGSNSQGTHSRHHQQQQFVSTSNGMGGSGPSGNWQSDNDTPHRREMIQHILKLLKKDKNGSPESMNKLPQMAKQLEVSLYRNARSFEAYMDMATLKQRLQQIAMEVSRKARGQGDLSQRDDRGIYADRSQSFSSQNGMKRSDRGIPGGTNSPFMGNSSSNSARMVALEEINPMSNPGGDMLRNGPAYSSARPPSHVNDRMSQSSHRPPVSQSSSSTQSRNDPDWKVRIRHKQQRLLLLHHSAKCMAEEGRCTMTSHCGDMKRLWRHMEGCKDNNCRVGHCFSSRAILSHYRKCKDPSCPACGPVRDTVRKSRNSPSSRTMPNNSTGPMMNAMRGMAQILPPQSSSSSQGMMPSDPLGSSVGSYGNGGSSVAPPYPHHSSSASRAAMPPPSASGTNGSSASMQYQPPQISSPSQYRPSSRGGTQTQGPPPSVQPLYGSDRAAADSRMPPAPVQRLQDPISRPPMGSASSRSMASSGETEFAESQRIRHKQQRLLLLRHASRCQHEAGKCPATPHCASMKRLWRHIANCKDQDCSVQHCLSSRGVLSHYRRCKDALCPACGPVRETIRKSHEMESQSNPQGVPSDNRFMGRDDSFGRSSSVTSPTEQEPKRMRTEHRPSAASIKSARSTPVSAPPLKQEPPRSIGKGEKVAASAEKDSKGSVDRSLLESFSVKELETHLRSLERETQLPPAKLKSKCLDVLKGLMAHQHGWVFNGPVDPVELGLVDYFEIIKKPMDLGTIQKRLENSAYHSIDDFKTDIFLTFENAMVYNEDGSVVYDMAKQLKVKAESDMKRLVAQLETEDLERRQNERACTLCGSEKLLFEPPVYFCNGINCQSQRIRRNSHFYIGGNNQYFWCSPCFNELDDKIPIELADLTVMKNNLKKKKNDEIHEESWVQCDTCERWVHQICGLFNTRQNKEHHSEYCCPKCLLEKRKTVSITPAPKPLLAADLPRTTLSEWLERSVTKKVEKRKRELAEERSQNEGISLEEALRQVESGGPIIIRQVTAMDRKLEVRELMKKRYAHKNYPDEFPFRCKSIVVFQHLDGVDVILFALYLYEHGEDNPPPNQRTVYISYLDSVHFMRPRKLRTFVYHEILIAYLDYARRRGFATAHIWACPPLKGDDYIFYAKPEDQKTPRDSRLRLWYIDMLVECQKRSIVGKVTNMYDIYFADPNLDATAVPYLEGDYFPGEAENIIKMLEEGGGKKLGSVGKKKKSKSSKAQKNKGGNTGTRSTGVDEEALIASGILDGTKSLKDLDRDQVMVKLGETIQPMKESFIVAFLNWKDAREEDMIVPEEIEMARIEYAAKGDPELVGSKRDAAGNMRDATSKTGANGEPVKVIDDDAEDLDCEFLNNRQAFLNLCRGNHYQFDELRRAKHTSLMLLWHLHNRDAPKFVQQCVSCSREILSGKRFHCDTCPDYDLCQDCYKDPKANRGNCTHALKPLAVEADSGQDRSGLSEQERMQRQRNLLLHIQLIEHASRCSSQTCSSLNCAKMKKYLQHARVCKVKVLGGCKICKKIWTLLRIHAQKCKDTNCPIPQCNAIREKMRQLQKQQQAMDDRRRLEMNRHMRFSTAGGS
jgi:E1A/CREB-binding protein